MGGQRTAALLRWGTIPLRLIVGYGFMAHGVAKIVNGPGRFMDILQALGVPAPHLMGWATIVIELAGGLAVLIGAFVPLVSIPLGAVLVVAALTVHLPYGFSSTFLLAGGRSSPTSVAARDSRNMPPGTPADAGISVRCVHSLRRRMTRRILMPHTCPAPDR